MTESQEATVEDITVSTPIFARLLAEQANGGVRVTAPAAVKAEPKPQPSSSVEDPLVAPADPTMAGDE